MNNFDTFVSLDPQVLKKGMLIDSEVYSIRNNHFILLCSHSKITDEILSSIESYHLEGNGIFVSRKYFNYLIKKYGVLPGDSGKALIQLKYKMLKNNNYELIHETRKTKVLDIAKTDSISQSLNFHIENSDTASILKCISQIKLKDEYLYTHGINVGMLNYLQGKWLNLSTSNCETLSKIGILHDIGKLKISQKLLNKPGKLTDHEYDLIKMHPIFSYEILQKSGITDRDILDGVKYHHERMNGSGYPDGLRFSEISLYARITAISDTYDAMVSKRSYKRPFLPFEIMACFAENKFSNLDIQLVNIFLTKLPEELKGKSVILSNGKAGIIQWLNPKDYRHPLVLVDNKLVQTDDNLYCVSIDSNF